VTRYLAELSTDSGLLIALEDLHWASESTLQLLHYLTRHLTGCPILTVGTFRPEATGLEHPLLVLRCQLARDRLVTPLRLSRLSPEATTEIVLEMSGAGESVVLLATRLCSETEGNPFFLMEIIKALFETDVLRLQGGVWQGDFVRISEGEIPLPPGLSEAIGGRLHRLGEEAQETLRLAAVLGQAFDFDLLNQVWGRGEEKMLMVLDQLLRQRLLDEGTGVMGRDYTFNHHKIQEVVYAGMLRRRRQFLHARVGRAMEQLRSPDTQMVAAELAFHFEQACQLEESSR
jgi:predicted ATPase